MKKILCYIVAVFCVLCAITAFVTEGDFFINLVVALLFVAIAVFAVKIARKNPASSKINHNIVNTNGITEEGNKIGSKKESDNPYYYYNTYKEPSRK